MALRYILILSFLLLLSCEEKEQTTIPEFQTHFETTKGKETATYIETIDFYIQLAKKYPEINIQTIGETDSGNPLHLVTYNKDGDFNFQKISQSKSIILINNGIHPGEPDGIDATMLLFRDLANGTIAPPKRTVLATIPIYNIGGALNRNTASRANQNGPKEYGFRGNANNFDLNRDFIKSDTKNARTFAKIFHELKPDVFIDNHVSNGADYQYTLTHLFTQHNKLGTDLGPYLDRNIRPKLEKALAAKKWDITPYVNVFNSVPEAGFSQFMDYPRYSTGYTTLWNTLSLMVETHMLKPYDKRVQGTYELMKEMVQITEDEQLNIKDLRAKAFATHENLKYYPVQWAIDTTKSSTLNFKGYKADTLLSEVTNLPRLKYDSTKPFTKKVTYQNYFKATDSVLIPAAYIINRHQTKVIDLLHLNNIQLKLIKEDTTINVESYKIANYKTYTSAYEGHYPHYKTTVSSSLKTMKFNAGDYIVKTNQPGIRYLIETLEPAANDSFFNWNFFDTILQQKEGFSAYVFEDEAVTLLQQDSLLRMAFRYKQTTDSKFANDAHAQLSWLFKKSKHYEAAHLQYPIYRILKAE